MEHPRVLWNNIARRATVAATAAVAGYDAEFAMLATEGEEYQPSVMPAVWQLTFDSPEPVSAVAIQAHTIGSSGATVAISRWNGSAWVQVMSATPEDDEPIAFLFARETDAFFQISLSGPVAPKLGVIMVCDALELPQKVYNGAPTPIDMALQTTYAVNTSNTGRYLGRSVLYSKNENEFNVEHLTERFVRDELMPFIRDAREYPYFLLERPYSRPTALSYRWRQDDITPQRMGVKAFMSVSL